MANGLLPFTPILRIEKVSVDVSNPPSASDIYSARSLKRLLEMEEKGDQVTKYFSPTSYRVNTVASLSEEKATPIDMLLKYLAKNNSPDPAETTTQVSVTGDKKTSRDSISPSVSEEKAKTKSESKKASTWSPRDKGHRNFGPVIAIYTPAKEKSPKLPTNRRKLVAHGQPKYLHQTDGKSTDKTIPSRLNPEATIYTPRVSASKAPTEQNIGLQRQYHRGAKTHSKEDVSVSQEESNKLLYFGSNTSSFALPTEGKRTSTGIASDKATDCATTRPTDEKLSGTNSVSKVAKQGEKQREMDIASVVRSLRNAIDSLQLHASKTTAEGGCSENLDADDAASQDTRGEYWSVSSYHTTSHGPPADEEVTPAEFPSEFQLPVESLLKPIKKSTYEPITQDSVQRFLEDASWQNGALPSQEETQWTSKRVPLEPVPIGRRQSERDRFLENIQRLRPNEGQRSEQSMEDRSRLERYPGSEIVYQHFSQEFINDHYLEHVYVKVKRISTQNTNPPVWYFRRHSQNSGSGEGAEAQESPPKKLPTTKECRICFADVPFEDYPQSMHVAGHSICKNCMKKYIGTKILRQGDLKIQCPSDDCAIILQYDEIREYGSNAAFRLYDELLSRRAYEEDPNFRWCTNRSCSVGQIVEDGGTSTYFVCQGCNFKSCFECRTPSHPSITCAQNLAALGSTQFAADEPSGAWLKSYTRPCHCGRWIQKMDGCDHVKCPARPLGCGEEWCWMCGAKYDDIRRIGNTAHKVDCPHFA